MRSGSGACLGVRDIYLGLVGNMDVLSLHIKLQRVSALLVDALEAAGVLDLNKKLHSEYWEGIQTKLQGLCYQDEGSYWKEVEVLTTHHVTKTDMGQPS